MNEFYVVYNGFEELAIIPVKTGKLVIAKEPEFLMKIPDELGIITHPDCFVIDLIVKADTNVN